jgi:hypothetical protein
MRVKPKEEGEGVDEDLERKSWKKSRSDGVAEADRCKSTHFGMKKNYI